MTYAPHRVDQRSNPVRPEVCWEGVQVIRTCASIWPSAVFSAALESEGSEVDEAGRPGTVSLTSLSSHQSISCTRDAGSESEDCMRWPLDSGTKTCGAVDREVGLQRERRVGRSVL